MGGVELVVISACRRSKRIESTDDGWRRCGGGRIGADD